MTDLSQDVNYAVRTLAKHPSFAAVVIVILALGIGANVAMFSVTDAVMFRSLPYPDANQLALGRTTYSGNPSWNVSAPDYYDYRDQVEVFESLAAILSFTYPVTVTGGEEPERVPAILASVDFFPTLGVNPQLGRNFTLDEADLTAPDVAIISHGYWQRRFGGSPDVIGSTLVTDGVPQTIVGVMPADFFFIQDVDIYGARCGMAAPPLGTGSTTIGPSWVGSSPGLRSIRLRARSTWLQLNYRRHIRSQTPTRGCESPGCRTSWCSSIVPCSSC